MYSDVELIISNHPNLSYNYHVAFRCNLEFWIEIACDNEEQADKIFYSINDQLDKKLDDAKIKSYDVIVMADSIDNQGLEQCLMSTGN